MNCEDEKLTKSIISLILVIDAFILFRFASNCSFEEIKRINPDNSAYLCRSIFRMTSFSELGLREELLEAIADLGYTAPTPIQEQSIPLLSEQITLLHLLRPEPVKQPPLVCLC